jgi:hypothetical protein
MATVLHGGELELSRFMGGEPRESTLRYIRNQAAAIGEYAKRTGSRFAEDIVRTYDSFYSDEALSRARVALSRVKSYFKEDRIEDLINVHDMQQAGSQMQRFMMSNPLWRELYHQGRCNGFAGKYVDPNPGKIGDDDYNYRRVMDGIIVLDAPSEENPEGGWHFNCYIDELHEDDRDLDLHEQLTIQRVWKRMEYAARNGLFDITNQDGGML